MSKKVERGSETPEETLRDMLSPSAVELLSTSGIQIFKSVGLEIVRGVVLNVLCGRNLRDSTEALTRRRLAALNLAIVEMFVRGKSKSPEFIHKVLDKAAKVLLTPRSNKQERWLAMWLLGLTEKASQNVLRDSRTAIQTYKDVYVQTCERVIGDAIQQHGECRGRISIGTSIHAEVDWAFMMYLLNAIGAETLGIRGSEKSTYGKLFEKLILGSVLHILGFELVPPGQEPAKTRVFCLSSRKERRESDATLFYEKGKAVRFDIGFIGRGNPEISSDKLTRFEKQIMLHKTTWSLATFIIVDRIGQGSKIEPLAKEVGARLIQMSLAYWPQQLARELRDVLGYRHELISMKHHEIRQYLAKKILTVPMEKLAGFVPDRNSREEQL